MNLTRRTLLQLTAGAATLPAVSHVARAQAYPSRPVRFIVPFAPGGGTDHAARTIGGYMARALGQQVIVENKPGAGGLIGIETAAKSAPDGYTVLISADTLASTPHVANVNTDYIKNLVPVIQLTNNPVILAVHSTLGVNSIDELIHAVKLQPGMGYATPRIGTRPAFCRRVVCPHRWHQTLSRPLSGRWPSDQRSDRRPC